MVQTNQSYSTIELEGDLSYDTLFLLVDNFLTTAKEVGYTQEDIYQICCNVFNATFMSPQDKEIISDVFSGTNGRCVMLLAQGT